MDSRSNKKVLRVLDGIAFHMGDRVLVDGKFGEGQFPGTISGLGDTSDTLSVWMDDNKDSVEHFHINRIHPMRGLNGLA